MDFLDRIAVLKPLPRVVQRLPILPRWEWGCEKRREIPEAFRSPGNG